MKLRLKNNSVRLRLTQGEVARLAWMGRVEERIEFGLEPQRIFVYALQAASDAENVRATFENNGINVFVPKEQAEYWTQTAQVGIEAKQTIGGEKTLRILIEKDFDCLEPRPGEDDADAFPHPSGNVKC
jgi:hypothetical protein